MKTNVAKKNQRLKILSRGASYPSSAVLFLYCKGSKRKRLMLSHSIYYLLYAPLSRAKKKINFPTFIRRLNSNNFLYNFRFFCCCVSRGTNGTEISPDSLIKQIIYISIGIVLNSDFFAQRPFSKNSIHASIIEFFLAKMREYFYITIMLLIGANHLVVIGA